MLDAEIVLSSPHEVEEASLDQISEAIEEGLESLIQEELREKEAEAPGDSAKDGNDGYEDDESSKVAGSDTSQTSSVRTETNVSAATVKTSSQRDSSTSSEASSAPSDEVKQQLDGTASSASNDQVHQPSDTDSRASIAVGYQLTGASKDLLPSGTSLIPQTPGESERKEETESAHEEIAPSIFAGPAISESQPAVPEKESTIDEMGLRNQDVQKESRIVATALASRFEHEAELSLKVVQELGPVEEVEHQEDDHQQREDSNVQEERSKGVAQDQEIGIISPQDVCVEQRAIHPASVSAATVDSITESIWRNHLLDFSTALPPQLLLATSPSQQQQQQVHVKALAKPHQPTEHQALVRAVRPPSGAAVTKSPTRSKPQDLMLTTFDISSSDSSSSAENDRSPTTLPKPIAVVTSSRVSSSHSPSEEDEDDDGTAGPSAASALKNDLDDNDFYDDDDFGLSAIRQEAELLRLQQLRVEAEIARIQREEAEGAEKTAAAVRQIPDKPPPPYVPPPGQPIPKPARPPPPGTFLPSSREQVGKFVDQLAEQLFRMKEELGSWDQSGMDSEIQLIVEKEISAVGTNLRQVAFYQQQKFGHFLWGMLGGARQWDVQTVQFYLLSFILYFIFTVQNGYVSVTQCTVIPTASCLFTQH